jgi:hypothetical protein
MVHDTKIAIVIRYDLATWQKLNVAAYMASAIAAGRDGVIGLPYQDADGAGYLAMLGQPVLVFSATGPELAMVRQRTAERGLSMAISTEELFTTGDDESNRAVVRAVPTEKLALVGIGLHGRRSVIDKILKGLRLHP